ncbi:MAG: 16S rRNA (cytidine(1402)-2'-O)-methyltransferase [Tissierellia bacterium]|nr:16S rRNA (cytidine(1402)-2'-O)-methyltransferase [Tissierellia bacterium]
MKKGTLYICPTPIGNLEDITLRTLNVLKEVDLIAAEDTRHTIKLLNHYNIKKPLTSYHEHNIKEKGIELIDKLNQGKNIALVSDAGMPGISDPGEDLIKKAIEADIEVVPLPGPTASITALIVSGLSTDKFIFYGFLAPKKKDRIKELEEIKEYRMTTIVYEAPHRLLSLLEDMVEVLGERKISVSRELTKKYEETFRGTPKEALEKFRSSGIKGEFVIVIEGNKNVETPDIDVEKALREYLSQGYSKKEAVKKVSQKYNLPKNEVYKASLEVD